MSKLTINPEKVLSVAVHAATEIDRPQLAGVLFERNGTIRATNGHTLGVCRLAHDMPDHNLDSDWFIRFSSKNLTLIRKATRGDNKQVTLDLESGELVLIAKGKEKEKQVVDYRSNYETYPDFSQVWPKKAQDIGAISVNGEYVAKFGTRVALIFSDPTRAIVVRTEDPDFIGLIMPCRLKKGKDLSIQRPEWF